MKFWYVVIPSPLSLSDDERASVDAGGRWPRRICDEPPNLRPEIRALVDALVEKSLGQ